MRCKIRTLRQALREGLDNIKIEHGRLWHRLDKRPDKQEKDQEVMFYPNEEALNSWQSEMLVLQKELDDNIWGDVGREATAKKVANIKSMLDSVGHLGTLQMRSALIPDQFFVRMKGKAIVREISEWYLWVPDDVESPDFRPDETLPEDYYAL